MKKLYNFFKHFFIVPTDLQGGWRFQINIPIGKDYAKEDNRHTIK